MRVVNLARRPFVNDRPVSRVALLSWILAALLLLVNALLYGAYWSRSADIRSELAELDQAIASEAAAFDDLATRLETLDLGVQNDDVRFLNLLIDYRTFPWSGLFEDLEATLPDDVRLVSVSPAIDLELRQSSSRTGQRRGPGQRAAASRRPTVDSSRTEVIPLSLEGFSRREEALYELLDSLYANPRFRQPVLDQETLREGSREIAFSLEVSYLTRSGSDGGFADDEPRLFETEGGIAVGDRTADPATALDPTTFGEDARLPTAGRSAVIERPSGTLPATDESGVDRRAYADSRSPGTARSEPRGEASDRTGAVRSPSGVADPPRTAGGGLPPGAVVGLPQVAPPPTAQRPGSVPTRAPSTPVTEPRRDDRTPPREGSPRQPTGTRPDASGSARLGGGGRGRG